MLHNEQKTIQFVDCYIPPAWGGLPVHARRKLIIKHLLSRCSIHCGGDNVQREKMETYHNIPCVTCALHSSGVFFAHFTADPAVSSRSPSAVIRRGRCDSEGATRSPPKARGDTFPCLRTRKRKALELSGSV